MAAAVFHFTECSIHIIPTGFYEPWLVYHSENHQCKNWDKIKGWAIDHAATKHIPQHPNEAQRKGDALNEPWFDPYHIKYIDGLCGNEYC